MPAAIRTVQQVRDAFSYDPETMRYRRTSTGRFVKADAVRRATRRVVDYSAKRIRRLGKQFAKGEIGLQEFETQMRGTVKDLHLAATAAAKGGFGSMTSRDYGLVGARLRFHYERLDVFARLIEDARLSVGQIKARAGLYANAGVGVYENARREAAQGVMTEERRVLGVAEHCGVCVEQAGQGWQPLNTLRRLGDSPCRANCKCRFKFRK
jgi:hypothetical protein